MTSETHSSAHGAVIFGPEELRGISELSETGQSICDVGQAHPSADPAVAPLGDGTGNRCRVILEDVGNKANVGFGDVGEHSSSNSTGNCRGLPNLTVVGDSGRSVRVSIEGVSRVCCRICCSD